VLEPDPDFGGGVLSDVSNDCSHTWSKFDTTSKTWSCTWNVNSDSNWLTTDGTKIVVDTSLATASSTYYYSTTWYYLWCACSGTTYTYYGDMKGDTFYFQIKTAP
jgi:hypothetical protein